MLNLNDRQYVAAFVSSRLNQAVGNLGTLSTQDADDVNIEGGAIDGTTIGSSTPDTGSFTTIVATTSVQTPVLIGSSDTLEQRNGTNAQSFYIYNTYTDALNNEFFRVQWSGNICRLEVAKNGTGSFREFRLKAGNVDVIQLSGSGDFNLGSVSLQIPETSSSPNKNIVLRSDLNYIGVMSDHQLVWRSLATGNFFSVGSIDTGIGRDAAGIVKATDGSTGIGKLKATEYKDDNGGSCLGYKSNSADPTTTDFPSDKNWGVFKNTSSGAVFLAFNDGGSIKKVQLT